MANFTTKTIKEIFDSFMAKYNVLRNKYGDNSPLLEKSFIKSIGYAISGVAGTLWQMSVHLYKQCFPQSCDLETLLNWGNLVNVSYVKGRPTTLILKLNNVTASYLVSGTVYKDLDTGLIYKTVSQVNAENGQIIANAQCATSGIIGNIQVGTVLNIANPLEGIPSTAIVTGVLLEGHEDENIEIYRDRVIARYRSRAQGGSLLDYYNWCMGVQGIADALPYILDEGIVTIFLVGNGSRQNRNVSGSITPNPFPLWVNGIFTEYTGSGLMLEVAKAIEESEEGNHDRRPMTARVTLKQPNYASFSIEIIGLTNISYNEKIKDAIIASLDSKRPHIQVLGRKKSLSKINRQSLASIVQETIGDETFTSFSLKNSKNEEIAETTLGVGCLAYLANLKINGTQIDL